jgi:hypothetical protein
MEEEALKGMFMTVPQFASRPNNRITMTYEPQMIYDPTSGLFQLTVDEYMNGEKLGGTMYEGYFADLESAKQAAKVLVQSVANRHKESIERTLQSWLSDQTLR